MLEARPSGFPKFTNEVQHQSKVLAWETLIRRSAWKSGREIARLRALGRLGPANRSRCGSPAIDGGSGAEAQVAPARWAMPAQLLTGNQQAHARRWRGCPAGAGRSAAGCRSWPVWAGLGLRRRWPGVVAWTRVGRSSRLRASTGSSTPWWRGRRTTPGGATFPGQGQARLSRPARRQPCHPHHPSGSPSPTPPCRRRPRHLWPLGGGPDALRQLDGPALLALAERHSRLVLLARLPVKGADVTADTIARLLAPLPPEWRQTITFDNGTEFARHYRLHAVGIQPSLR